MRSTRRIDIRSDGVSELITDGGQSDGYAMLIFDDGRPSHYRASQLLEDFDHRGVFAIITGRVGRSSHLTLSQLRSMRNHGHRIESHTVTHANKYPTQKLTGATTKQVEYECRESKKWLVDNGFRSAGAQTIVYPRGGVDQRVADIARKYYTFGFGPTNDELPLKGWDDPLRIGRSPVQDFSTTLELIRKAGRNGGMVPIMLHDIVSDAAETTTENDITPDQLRRLCRVMNDSGVQTLTPREWKDIVRSQTSTGLNTSGRVPS